VDWVIIAISGAIVLALAVWTVLREDGSTARRGRHRGRPGRSSAVPPRRPGPLNPTPVAQQAAHTA
jgi:hypothetical protein